MTAPSNIFPSWTTLALPTPCAPTTYPTAPSHCHPTPWKGNNKTLCPIRAETKMISLIGKDLVHNNTLNLLNGYKDLPRKKADPHRWLNQHLSQPLESLDRGVSLELRAHLDHLDQRENQEEMVLKGWTESKVLLEMWLSSPPTSARTRALTTNYSLSSHRQFKT